MDTETILLVEAEPAEVAVMSASLKSEGYRVLAAGNYDAALGIFDQYRENIDFLVTDISLPGNNGCELAKNILNAKPDTKVLLVSGHTPSEVSRFCGLSLSDVHFLQKPFETHRFDVAPLPGPSLFRVTGSRCMVASVVLIVGSKRNMRALVCVLPL